MPEIIKSSNTHKANQYCGNSHQYFIGSSTFLYFVADIYSYRYICIFKFVFPIMRATVFLNIFIFLKHTSGCTAILQIMYSGAQISNKKGKCIFLCFSKRSAYFLRPYPTTHIIIFQAKGSCKKQRSLNILHKPFSLFCYRKEKRENGLNILHKPFSLFCYRNLFFGSHCPDISFKKFLLKVFIVSRNQKNIFVFVIKPKMVFVPIINCHCLKILFQFILLRNAVNHRVILCG